MDSWWAADVESIAFEGVLRDLKSYSRCVSFQCVFPNGSVDGVFASLTSEARSVGTEGRLLRDEISDLLVWFCLLSMMPMWLVILVRSSASDCASSMKVTCFKLILTSCRFGRPETLKLADGKGKATEATVGDG